MSGAPWMRRELLSLAAYSAGPPAPPGAVKLDANELPASLPADRAVELGRHLARVAVNRYPDPGCTALREACGRALGVDPGRLVFGNGSDELIFLLCSVFAEPPKGRQTAAVLYPVPTFSVFRIAALAAGMDTVEVPLLADFHLDEPAMDRALGEHRPNLAFIPRPNNPTGTLWSGATMLSLAQRHPGTLFIADEAYAEYSGDSLLSHVGELPNLVVMRTLSKIGLAALRVGFVQAPDPIVDALERVRAPYNIGALNQAAATWVLEHALSDIRALCAEVVSERGRLARALAAVPGVQPFDSAANLILFRVADAAAVWEGLRSRGVVVRVFGSGAGPLADCLRVTIGAPAENDRFLAALGEVVS